LQRGDSDDRKKNRLVGFLSHAYPTETKKKKFVRARNVQIIVTFALMITTASGQKKKKKKKVQLSPAFSCLASFPVDGRGEGLVRGRRVAGHGRGRVLFPPS